MLFENLGKKEKSDELNGLKDLLEMLKGVNVESEKSKEEKPKEKPSNNEVQFIKDITLTILNILIGQEKMMQQGTKIVDSDMTATPFRMKFMLAMIASKKYTEILLELVSDGLEELSKYPERFDKEYMDNLLKLSLELQAYMCSSKEV